MGEFIKKHIRYWLYNMGEFIMPPFEKGGGGHVALPMSYSRSVQLVKFVYNFFLPQILYISRMKPSLNRTTILIVHGIELHAAFEERENKQKNAKL